MKIEIIALLGLIVLSACGGENKKATEEKAPMVQARNTNGLKIAFYYSDSLNNGYDYLREQDSLLKLKQAKFEKELMSRQRGLEELGQRIEMNRQKQVMTAVEIQQMEQQFLRKQQDAGAYQQSEGGRLEQEASEILTVISKKVEEAGKEYCKKYGIDMLLIHGQGGQINFINSAMDVTDSFIEFVNLKQKEMDKDLGK